MRLDSRVALVTGGAVRIGRAISTELARHGCVVIVHYDTSAGRAARLTRALGGERGRAHAVQGHLASELDCERLIEAAWSCAGRLDILVNNAAVFHKESLMQATEASLEAELRTNAWVPVFLTRALARRHKAGAPGRRGRAVGGVHAKVVNLLDQRIAGDEVGCLPYLLSKKMLAAFTRQAALELAPLMTVNGVAPGAVLSPPRRGPVRVRDWAGESPLQRRVRPADIAAAVLFLLEQDAITGQTIFVDGGQHLAGDRAAPHGG